ncbi:DNA-binding response regulator [Ferrigenium kumadai]|uniref:DNA-binding response regulator n=1 Tax=Ferrigenium kumadai TaxID=1682490 RepID=A0AAN1VZV6_9PROT|nr:response regulator transcription factor [Ferrigenium kumadai]BBI98916.1 DNA-binding response regulator [Ferrigenium kumadai]
MQYPFSADRKAKVMVVDDHAIVRQGMFMLINREPDLHACCEAADIEQAVEANRACPHDIAIVDMSLDNASGLELVRRFQVQFPELKLLVLSMHDESIYAEPALKAGASGYLMKQMATDVLLHAVRKILRGELYLSDQMHSRMLKKMMGGAKAESPVGNLSPAELEVLHLIGLGMGTGEIADKLARSIKTIESHKANIKKKLDLVSGNQLTLFAINLVSSRVG